MNEVSSVLLAGFVVAVGYHDRVGERQAADERCEETDGHPPFKSDPFFRIDHDVPIQVSSVFIVHLSVINSLRLVQIFMYATPISVIGAETQADQDDGRESVRGEVAQLLVAAEERAKRIGAVKYAAAINIDATV